MNRERIEARRVETAETGSIEDESRAEGLAQTIAAHQPKQEGE